MQVIALILSKEMPEDSPDETGDICYFWPINNQNGDMTFDNFIGVRMDIKIPCGDEFEKQPPKCDTCALNDPDLCDVIKYTSWKRIDIGGGKLRRRNVYKFDRSEIISGPLSEDLIKKPNKTRADKQILYKRSRAILRDKSLLRVKDGME